MSWRKVAAVCIGVGLSMWAAGCGGGSKPIGVTVTDSSATVDPTDTSTLTATVANDTKNAGVTWSVSGGGTLSSQTSSSATFTAPAPASSALTVTVTATSVSDATKTGTVTITVPAGPSVATSALTPATVGAAYSATLSGTGGIPPYTWSITSGTLPAGLKMTAGGVISGTPMASGAGSTNVTIKMVDAGSPNPLSATSTLGFTIKAAPAITFTTTTLSGATYNASYSASVAATGGAGTLTYTIASGALPTGLTLSSAGVISGTPTAVGTFSATVMAADAFGDSATQTLSLKVTYPQLAITAATLPTGYVGSVYTATTLMASGGSGTGYSFALQNGSSLPAGLALSTAGKITGTPTTAGTSTFTVVVTDSASNSATLAMSIVVKPGITISTATTLPTAYVGSAYSKMLAATGGSGTGYTWTV
ncbi:MAG TPA: putative Ig domain-containing protein, partial [Acidobacteriaceae bacterium]|nr:putative Ig domain-containing protein [Acidobacteriaceae bacterium]